MLLSVITQIGILFLTACVGYLAARLGYFDAATTGKLNRLLLNVCVPCMVVSSATASSSAYGPETVALALAGSVGICAFLPLSGWLLVHLLRMPPAQRPLYRFMTICSNVGFMGFPVVEAFYGTEAMFLNSLATMFQSILMFTFGVSLLVRASVGQGLPASASAPGDAALPPAGRTGRRRTVTWRTLVTPGLVASVVALALFFAGLQLPEVISGTLSGVGGITSSLSMMLIGASMVGVRPRSLFGDVRLHLYAVVKQVVFPLAVWFALAPVFPDLTVLGVVVLVLSMPVGAMAIVFADQYGSDTALTTRAIVLSTLYSFAALPLLGLVIV